MTYFFTQWTMKDGLTHTLDHEMGVTLCGLTWVGKTNYNAALQEVDKEDCEDCAMHLQHLAINKEKYPILAPILTTVILSLTRFLITLVVAIS